MKIELTGANFLSLQELGELAARPRPPPREDREDPRSGRYARWFPRRRRKRAMRGFALSDCISLGSPGSK
jgi:hypothetical protein